MARRLKLSRLSSDAVAALVEGMSGAGAQAAGLARRLYLETEGNPFYLIQTIRALFEQGVLRLKTTRGRATLKRWDRAHSRCRRV